MKSWQATHTTTSTRCKSPAHLWNGVPSSTAKKPTTIKEDDHHDAGAADVQPKDYTNEGRRSSDERGRRARLPAPENVQRPRRPRAVESRSWYAIQI